MKNSPHSSKVLKNEDRIIEALQLQITSGRFKSLNELAAFLGLTETTKSKLYNVFNKDMNAGYKTICEWLDKLGISLISNEDITLTRQTHNKTSSNDNELTFTNLSQNTHSQNDIISNISFDKSDTSPTISRIAEHAPKEVVKGDDLHLIPVYGFTGAGGEVELIENDPIAIISILPEYNHKNMYPLKVSGDSMQPTIPKGSYVGIIPYEGILQEGGVYLIEKLHIGRMIKRIKVNTCGELSLYSDNPEYEPILLDKFLDGGEIIGRIMWVLRMP